MESHPKPAGSTPRRSSKTLQSVGNSTMSLSRREIGKARVSPVTAPIKEPGRPPKAQWRQQTKPQEAARDRAKSRSTSADQWRKKQAPTANRRRTPLFRFRSYGHQNSTASDTSRNQLAAATENATLPKAPARVAAAKRSAIPARPVVTLSIKLMQPSRSVARLFPQRGSQTPDVQPRTDEPDGHRP